MSLFSIAANRGLDGSSEKDGGPSIPDNGGFGRSLVLGLVLFFAVVVVGAAGAYLSISFGSVGLYGASLEGFLSFLVNVVVVSGAAIAALVVILTTKRRLKQIRKGHTSVGSSKR